MRRLLTGYAVSYNRRHRRSGHLLQNRFKSILCQENLYLKELVAYIHLMLEKVSVPLIAQVFQTLSMASDSGRGEQDYSAMVEIFEEWTGVKVEKRS